MLSIVSRPSTASASLVAVCALLLSWLPGTASAQLPQTLLTAISPGGGQAGTSVDFVVLAGTDLEDISELRFSHAGITAVPKTRDVNGKPEPIPNQFTVTIAADVPPGLYDVRAAGYFGLSNPRTFVVGTSPEVAENDANNTFEQAMEVPIGTVVNGRSNGTADVDYYRFAAKTGQRLLIYCQARLLDSTMERILELYDPNGRRIAYRREIRRVDPVIDFVPPVDGNYTLRVFDETYRGGNEYLYRLNLQTGPYVDFVFPPVGQAGTTQSFTVFGRNLPNGQPAELQINGRPLEKLDVQIALPADSGQLDAAEPLAAYETSLDAIPYVLRSESAAANPVQIQLATTAVLREQEPNDKAETAGKIQIPVNVAGQFQSRNDVDVFEFSATAGEEYAIEVFGQRGCSNVDALFVLEQLTKDKDGKVTAKVVTTQDDNPANIDPKVFETLTDDPYFRLKVAADSDYRLTLRDRYSASRGDASLSYRLEIRKLQPDFRLVVMPLQPAPGVTRNPNTWSTGLRRGEAQAVAVYVHRIDGFTGPVEVNAGNLPTGVTCPPIVIPENENVGNLVFIAVADAPVTNAEVQVTGTATTTLPKHEEAVTAAKKSVETTAAEVTKQQTAIAPLDAALKKAQGELEAARKAVEGDAANEDLKKKVTAAEQAVAAAQAAYDKAKPALTAAEQAAQNAQAALAAAEKARTEGTRTAQHQARSVTIVWSPNPNEPPVTRVSEGIAISVLPETAPARLETPNLEFQARPGQRLLLPVKLFIDDTVKGKLDVTATGLPKNSNIAVENKSFTKEAPEGIMQVTLKDNALLGRYTIYVDGQVQVGYQRRLDKLKEAEVAQAEAAKAHTAAQETLKAKTAERDASVKKTTDLTNQQKAAAEKLAAVQKQLAQVTETLTKSQTELTTAQNGAKTAEEKAAAVKKSVDDATAAAKAAADKAAGDGASDDDKAKAKAAADEVTKIQKELDTATAALKTAQAAATAAQQKVTDLQKQQTDTQAAVKQADEAHKKVTAELATAAEAQKKSDEAFKQSEADEKAALAAKQAADKALDAAKKVSAAKNVNFVTVLPPVRLTVKPAPVKVTASIADGGKVKQGAEINCNVKVERLNGFTGPVQLQLDLPPNVKGISAAAVTIPADQTAADVKIQVAADAPEGAVAYAAIRAQADFDGPAAVDAPVAVTVTK